MQSPHIRSIALDIVLTFLTCGLFNFYVQYRQIEAANEIIKQRKYDFIFWLLFCIITCGLYHIYHEYRKSCDIADALKKDPTTAGLIAVLLTLFQLWWVNDAIQQAEINEYFGNKKL